MHPLDPVTPDEFLAGRDILAKAGWSADTGPVRFAYYGLDEPPKNEPPKNGDATRRLRAFLINLETGTETDALIDLTSNEITRSYTLDPASDGHLPILESDIARLDEIVQRDERWREAMARRGITDLTKVRACPMTAGNFTDSTRRMVRVLAFLQPAEHALVWAHPIDGVTGYADLIANELIEVIDEFTTKTPNRNWDYDDPEVRGPYEQAPKPIRITQPEGTSFTLSDHTVTWHGWTMRIGFDAREGLTLHEIGLNDRPLIYRASIAEMVVPYGDPRFRYWQAYFDTGEYLVGKWVNSLELGCDCLGEITYLDAVVCGETGEPREVRNAICVHEEDFGILWKHTDIFNGSAQSRRQRRLVVSYFTTVGNYDYGFYWYFYLDGTIECEVKMTGVVFTAGYPEGGHPYSTEVAPGLGAPVHQHLFSARLDVSVDGLANAVEEVDVHGLPVGPDNPYGNAIARRVTRLSSEAAAARPGDASHGRVWRVISTERVNRFGQPTAFTLHPEPNPALLASPDSPVAQRAGFAARALWVTRYDPAQRYPAGDFVNQSPGGGGLPAYIAGDKDIDGQDIVVWHTFGPTHVVRTEDWPVMPVTRTGFMLKPSGFFDRNPTLDVPSASGRHCHTD